jgi:signal peptidase
VPRRLGNGLVNLLVVAVMLCCAGWLAPHFLGYSRYVITSGSMTGTYDQGSVVFEKPVPAARLRVGDVITYMPPPDAGVPHLVTHRIISMKPAEGGGVVFTTQGDANPDPDPWHFELVQATQPVVHFGVPHVGWIFIALAHREVRMLAIGVPAGLVGLSALVQLLGGIRESHRDRRNRRNGRNEVVSTRGRHVTAGGPVVAKP